MKFTLSWLKDHLDTDADLATIVATLNRLGLEVDDVTDRGAELAAFKVAHVVSAEQHPNADRLRVCIVDTGSEQVQVVCGAPNARTGMRGVFAAVGTRIPGTGIDLKKGVIRGVESNGMLCSERELELSDEHSGIIDLPADTPVGAAYAAVAGLDDPIIDIDLTPDRGDCAGVRGVARDLAAAGLGTLKPLAAESVAGEFPCPIDVKFAFPSGGVSPCSLFVGRVIRSVRNGPSPAWMQDRLRAVGLRPISALVDVTNFFTVDRCRPLHVFDAGKVTGDLRLRSAESGETFDALNDKTYTLSDGMTVICDDHGPDSLAGIMGGERTGCTDETVDVFVECALFDPVRTALTGRELQINSDARYRFERGVDPEAVIAGVEQATQLIQDMCGGEASELVVTGAVPAWRREIGLRLDRVRTLGGLDLPKDRQVGLLTAIGCEIMGDGDPLVVVPPSWRPDIHGEADLVEEILRLEGYDAIPAVSMERDSVVTRQAVSPARLAASRVQRTLAARGFDEAVTWSFMDGDTAARFGQTDPSMRLVNPIASDLDVMRPSILPNLARAAARNAARGFAGGCLFEVGPIYRDNTPKGQTTVAAGLRHDQSGPRHWSAAPRPVDVFDARGDALAVLDAIGAPTQNLIVEAAAPDWFHPGRSGVLRLGPKVLASFGELHPAVLELFDLTGPVAAFEVDLGACPLPRRKGTAKPLLSLSAFQPLVRDFAFVVAEDIKADQIVRAARGGDKKLIADIGVFDIYRGTGLPEGMKSVAIAVTLQPVEATLTDEEIDTIGKAIVASVEKHTGAYLRS